MAWIVARACVQSITVDEADTYVYFVSGQLNKGFTHWQPHSNNHLLNTLLIHIFTSLFGLSNLTMRAPALIGGAIYIAAAYRLCSLVSATKWIRWPLFVCLTYNPFVMDYLVAARGYSLALALLTVAIYLIFRRVLLTPGPDGRQLRRSCARVSALLALSFSANFAFAYVDFFAGAIFFAYAGWLEWQGMRNEERVPWVKNVQRWARLAAACLLPGLAIFLALDAWTVMRMPKTQLVYGSHSLYETWQGVIQANFFELNPQIVNPWMLKWLLRIQFVLPGLFFLVLGAQVVQAWQARKLFRESFDRKLDLLGSYLLAVAACSLVAHWIAFRVFGLLLPKNRTALFFVVLLTAAFGVLGSGRLRTARSDLIRGLTSCVLIVHAIFFVGCLRLSYFQEWQFDADCREGYEVLSKVAGGGHWLKVQSEWRYISAFNYYRIFFHDQSFAWFTPIFSPSEYQRGGRAYVLNSGADQSFIDQNHLRIVYRGKLSQYMVIAVSP